jgi:hypothetical protein
LVFALLSTALIFAFVLPGEISGALTRCTPGLGGAYRVGQLIGVFVGWYFRYLLWHKVLRCK